MKAASLCFLLLFQQPKSNPKTIRPDGITSTREHHRIDLSTCDIVRIKGPIRELNVQSGEFEIYWFKRYQDIAKLDFDCEIETRR